MYYEPKGNLMMQRYSLDFSYDQLYKPRAFTASAIELGSMIVFMNYWSLSVDAWITPWGENDYFEPRTDDMSSVLFQVSGLPDRIQG